MPEQPIRGSDLRIAAPTLEPDDVFVARLSSLAAANAPQVAAAPVAAWRVGIAAASVAAVLVGVAWLAGLDPTGSPNPAPTPATTPTAPVETQESSTQLPTASQATDLAGATSPDFGAVPPTTQVEAPGRPDRPDPENGNANGNANGTANSSSNESGTQPGKGPDEAPGRGPDEHAGNHPNENATTKAANGHQKPDKPDKPGIRDKLDELVGGRSGR